MRIVLCDHYELVRMSLARLLEREGHEVVATTGQASDLPSLVMEHQPDLCVVEVLAEGTRNVTDGLRAIEACAPKSDVVVLTSSLHGPVRSAALAAGASAVVSKCSSSAELLAQLEHRAPAPAPVVRRAAPVDRRFLTKREFEVLKGLVDGESTDRMAARLGLTHATVRSHVQNVLTKLGVHSRPGAVAVAVRDGLVKKCA